jgi:hypothetical protein
MAGPAAAATPVLWAWLAIIALGMFHGLNPGMGWLFAVSNGLQARSGRGVASALPPLALGHLLAIATVLVPVGVLLAVYLRYLQWFRWLAALALIGFGVYKLLNRRHPRLLARIGPRHLVLWSYLMATSHGAGLMLVPFYLDIGSGGPAGHSDHMARAAEGSLGLALLATALHTLAMLLSMGLVAWLVYRYLGLRLLGKSWFNLDLVWAVFLIAVGLLALVI